MADRATEFLTEWSLKRSPEPIARHDAITIAERWEAEAATNGVTPEALRAAAGGDIADYLLRTYGEADPDDPISTGL